MARRWGWRSDGPDRRDLRLRLDPGLAPLPDRASLRGGMPIVVDQGDLGSCTACATASALEYDRDKQGRPVNQPSRLFVYYNSRSLEDSVQWDAGAEIRDAIKAAARWGAPPEDLWPYSVARFAARPSNVAYASGLADRALVYARVDQTTRALRATLAAGFPVVVGFNVYPSFMTSAVADTGTVPMPTRDERLEGGHATLLTGYDHPAGLWLLRNSWGTAWGDDGYFTLPYPYLVDPGIAGDFWGKSVV